jgi:hypothetical protein
VSAAAPSRDKRWDGTSITTYTTSSSSLARGLGSEPAAVSCAVASPCSGDWVGSCAVATPESSHERLGGISGIRQPARFW